MIIQENNEKRIGTRILQKHDIDANWKIASDNNFIPKDGEIIIYDIDSNGSTTNPQGHTVKRYKIGDGKTKVNDLPFSSDQSVDMFVENSLVVSTPYTNQLVSIGFDATNKVVTPASALVGAALKGGCNCFEVKNVSVTANSYNATLTLDSVTGIAVTKNEDYLYSFSQHVDAGWTDTDCVDSLIVTAVNTSNKTVSVSASSKFKNWLTVKHPGSEYSKFKSILESLKESDLKDLIPATRSRLYRGFWCLNLPEIGTRPLSGGTMAVGAQSEALGQGSFANGSASRAGGQFSFATGLKNKALNNAAFAEGDNTVAEGEYSHSMGGYTKTRGKYSLAAGFQTIANGDNSAAFGINTVSIGYHSLAVGNLSQAKGNQSLATGDNTQAIGHSSLSGGYGSIATGTRSVALNYNTRANAADSIAVGSATVVDGARSIATNNGSKAVGEDSIATGLNTIAEGARSITAGVGSKTSKYKYGTTSTLSYHAVAIGNATEANYDEAFALGDHSIANHKASVAEGNRTKTGAHYQHVFGQFNEPISTDVLTVGWGSSDTNRKNIMNLSNTGLLKTSGGLESNKLRIHGDQSKSEDAFIKILSTENGTGYTGCNSTVDITGDYIHLSSFQEMYTGCLHLDSYDVSLSGPKVLINGDHCTDAYKIFDKQFSFGTVNRIYALNNDISIDYLDSNNSGKYLSAFSVIGDSTFIKKIYIGDKHTLLPFNENEFICKNVNNLEDYRVLSRKEISDTYLTKATASATYLPKFTTRPSYCVYGHMGAKNGDDDKLQPIQITSQPNELASSAYTLPYRVENGAVHVGEPTVDTHAATKKYVDNKLNSANVQVDTKVTQVESINGNDVALTKTSKSSTAVTTGNIVAGRDNKAGMNGFTITGYAINPGGNDDPAIGTLYVSSTAGINVGDKISMAYHVSGGWTHDNALDIVSVLRVDNEHTIALGSYYGGERVLKNDTPCSDLAEFLAATKSTEHNTSRIYKAAWIIDNPTAGDRAINVDSVAVGRENAAVGDSSASFGRSCKSNGDYTLTANHSSVANGTGSSALGSSTVANGEYSLAVGQTAQSNGKASFAAGHGSKANAEASAAFGWTTEANGLRATSFGVNTKANGNHSIAAGNGTIVDGAESAAFGNTVKVYGDRSLGIGYNNTVFGANAFVNGQGNTVSGEDTIAFGNDNTVQGDSTLAAGGHNTITSNVFYTSVFGEQNTVSGSVSTVTGYKNNVSGNFGLVAGQSNTVTGNQSSVGGLGNNVSGTRAVVGGESNTVTNASDNAAVFGKGNTVSGDHSLVGGQGNTVNGDQNLVAGLSNKVYGSRAVVGGVNNEIASGTYHAAAFGNGNTLTTSEATAFGIGNEVNHKNSFVEGTGNKTSGEHQHVMGTYNAEASQARLIIGNGTSDKRSNSHVFRDDGIIELQPGNTNGGGLKTYDGGGEATVKLNQSGAALGVQEGSTYGYIGVSRTDDCYPYYKRVSSSGTTETRLATETYVDNAIASVSGGGSTGSQSKNNGKNVELFSSNEIYDITRLDYVYGGGTNMDRAICTTGDRGEKIIGYFSDNNITGELDWSYESIGIPTFEIHIRYDASDKEYNLAYIDNSNGGMNAGGNFDIVIGEIHGSAGETYTLPRCECATSGEFAAICIIDKETGLQRPGYLFEKAVHGTYIPMGMNSTDEMGFLYEWTYGYYDKFDFTVPKDGDYLIVLHITANDFYHSCLPRVQYGSPLVPLTTIIYLNYDYMAYLFDVEVLLTKAVKQMIGQPNMILITNSDGELVCVPISQLGNLIT